MSKRNTKLDESLSVQKLLFDTEVAEGIFDISLGFRQCLSRTIHSCRKDRYQIAGEVSRLTQGSFSKDMLDKYTGSDTSYGIRAEALPAVCHTLGSLEPFRYLLEPLGSDVLNPEDRDLVRLARLEEQKRNLDAEIMQLRAKRGIR
ncbi:MAG: hypothetical protein PHO83_03705 [Geobacteraceae bacterium]|nr:hypothetical protein [Geobacteraceae bacterium]